MTSPIHSALFSPPPSPPTKTRDTVDIHTKHGIVSLKALLLPSSVPGSRLNSPSLNGSGPLKARSPRTPQNQHFTLDSTAFPSPSPSISVSGYPTRNRNGDRDIESALAPVSTPKSKRASSTPKIASPPYLPSNVPSTTIPIPSSLPRPLLRLIIFATLLVSSVLILVYVPTARLPSLRAASLSRRIALDDGVSGYHGVGQLRSWSDALDRDYKPPQVRVPHMMKRAFSEVEIVPGPLRAMRPNTSPRPLPSSHEILAIQSYLLDSAYNVLPGDLDPHQPTDANRVSNHKLGVPGSAAEKAWYEELEKENGQGVVVWYGGDGSGQLPHGVLDILHSVHGKARHPTLIPCHSRGDRNILKAIFDRLEIPFAHHPLVMIGNIPVIGDVERIEELKGSGKLVEMLKNIGWVADKEVEVTVAAVPLVEEEIDLDSLE